MARSEANGRERRREFTFDARPDEDFVGWPILKRLVRECFLPRWRLIAVTITAMTISAATAGAIPFLLQRVGDDVFVEKDTTLLFILPLLVVLVVLVRAAVNWTSAIVDGTLSTKIAAELRMRMFDTVAMADLAWIQGFSSGRFVSAFVADVGAVDRAGTRVLTALVKNGLSLIFLTGAMFYMDWRLSLLVLIGAPIAIFNLGKQKRRVRQATGQSLQISGEFNSLLTQTLQGMRVVKAYGQEANEAKRVGNVVRLIRKYIMKGTRSRATVSPVWEICTGVGVAAVIFYGGWQGIYGNVTLGHFMGFMTAGLLAIQPMRVVAGIQISLTEGLLAAQRVFDLIDYTSYVTEKPDARPLRVEGGAVSLNDVEFSYGTSEGPVLRSLNIDIPAGSKVALVGPSGAGKSTVLNLILRFFDPDSGTVLIDGQDIKDATIASVRGASSLLTQDPVIFDDTVAANIAYGSPDASEEAIVAAAEAAAAHDFIMRLPEGYQTRLGEAGTRLSGGERQRIAFARAMLRDTPVVLLDEPTSALDAESEDKVQAAMKRLLAGRTVVMIAHRLSTVKKADIIYCMDEGHVVESGTHAELVALRGRYAGMVKTQLLTEELAPAAAVGG